MPNFSLYNFRINSFSRKVVDGNDVVIFNASFQARADKHISIKIAVNADCHNERNVGKFRCKLRKDNSSNFSNSINIVANTRLVEYEIDILKRSKIGCHYGDLELKAFELAVDNDTENKWVKSIINFMIT